MENTEKTSKSKSYDESDVISLAKERFQIGIEAANKFREEAETDLKFKVGDQWDEKLKRDRENEGRPCLTINKLPQFSNQITNDIRQNKMAMKVYPVDDKADVETAKIIQGLLRHIEYQSKADNAYDAAVTSAVDTGLGFFRVFTEYVSPTSFNQRIKIGKIDNIFSVVFDPNSSEPDGSDAEWAFVYSDIPKKEFQRKYPKSKVADSTSFTSQNDKTDEWIKKDTVRIADYYCKEYEKETLLLLSNGESVLESELEEHLAKLSEIDPDLASTITVKDERETHTTKVIWYKIAGDEILEKTVFPAPFIPIIPVYGSIVNNNGEKHIYGIIRFARDPQKMYNIWTSAETEAIALAPKAPFIGVEGQFEGHEGNWATANVKTHAYLEYKPVSVAGQPAPPPQRQAYEPAVMAITNAKLGASDDLKSTTAIYNASLGMQSNEISGVAIRGRQQQAQTANYHFSDNLAKSIRHCGLIAIRMIPKIYDTARIERIMGEDGSEELVAINQPTFRDKVQRVYDLTVGEYDVAVETGPSFATKRQEAVASIMDFMRVYPSAAPIVGDLLVKNMDWNGAEEIANRLKKTIPPHLLDEQGNIPPQVQAQIGQMQQAIQLLQSQLNDANLKLLAKEMEIKSKERMKAAELETDILKEQMKLTANAESEAIKMQMAEMQAIQMNQGLPIQIQNQNFNGMNPQMDAFGASPQPINPTGGFSPG